jgi:protein-tyrosine phosphatase
MKRLLGETTMKKSLCGSYMLLLSLLSLSSAENPVTLNLLAPAKGSVTPDTRPSNNPFMPHTLDSSIPAPTNFAWSIQGNAHSPSYTLSVSEDSIFDIADIIANNLTDTMFPVWNLKINTPYYWRISARDSQSNAWNSPVFSFTTPDAWPRMIYVDGTTNVRDIGGRRNMGGLMIRQGLFYRSAELNVGYSATPKGLEQLKKLGIVCEIDLRGTDENPQIAMPWLRRYVRPVDGSGGGISSYLDGLTRTAGLECVVFKELSDPVNYPLILHCRIGADRTGTIVAVLEALLGCSEQQMGQNYIWTSLSSVGLRDTASVDWHDVISYLKSFDKQNATVQAGAWNYLQSIGMTVKELIAIRKIFLGDDRQPFPALASLRQSNHSTTKKAHVNLHYLITSSRGPVAISLGTGPVRMFNLSGKAIKPEWSGRQYSRLHLEP